MRLSFLYVHICCYCMPSETYGRYGKTPFSDLFTELPVSAQAAGVFGTLNCASYISF